MEMGEEKEVAGEAAGPGLAAGVGVAGVLPAGQKRFFGDAQEVWCAGSDREMKMLGVFVGLGVSAVGWAILMPMLSNRGLRWWWKLQNGFDFTWWDYGFMAGLLPVTMGLAAIGLWAADRVMGRTVLRLEPGYVVVRRRPFGWRDLARVDVREVAKVRVGVDANAAAMRRENPRRAVVLEMKNGDRMSLLDSPAPGEVEALAWEVADYHGLVCEMKPLRGVGLLGGGEWVAVTKEGMADLTGVEAWDERRVMEAGLKLSGGTLTARGEVVEVKPRSLAGELNMWMVAGGWIFLAGMFALAEFMGPKAGGLACLAVGVGFSAVFTLGLVFMMMEGRCPYLRVDGTGVTGWWGRLWRLTPETIKREEITGVSAGTVGLNGDWKSMELSAKQGVRTYWLSLELHGKRDRMLVRNVSGPAGYALGVARMMERRLGVGGVDGKGADEAAGEAWPAGWTAIWARELIDGAGRVRLGMAWWGRWAFLAAQVLAAVLFLVCVVTANPNVVKADAMEHYIVAFTWVGWGILVFSGVMLAILFPEESWVEVSGGKLQVKKRGWMGESTVFWAQAGEIERVWVYRGARRGPNGLQVLNGRVMLGMKGMERGVEIKGLENVSGIEQHACALCLMLGLEKAKVVTGVMMNGLVAEADESGDVLLDEAFGARLAKEEESAGRGKDRSESHEVVCEGEEVRVTRRQVLGAGIWGPMLLFAVLPCVGAGLLQAGVRESGMALLWVGGLIFLVFAGVVAIVLMEREWVIVREGRVESRRLWMTGSLNREYDGADVVEVVIFCEHSGAPGDEAGFTVGLKLKDGRGLGTQAEEYVNLVTGIRGVRKAVAIREVVRMGIRATAKEQAAV